MNSFFSAIKSKFSAKFDGRYLALVLQEIGNRHPKPLIAFICKVLTLPIRQFQRARFQTEYRFKGLSGPRFADLAVFVGNEEEPRVLIEIKYFDKPQLGIGTKPAQLEDYVTWKESSRRDSRNVMIISREAINAKGIANRSWGELARHLKVNHQQSDLIKMLIDYLEEEGVVMQDIDQRSLVGFFKRTLCGPKGVTMLANNLRGPAEFSSVLQNMRLLCTPLDLYFKAAWSSAGKKVDDQYSKSSRIATIDYTIENQCNTDDPKKLLDADQKSYYELLCKNKKSVFISQSAKDGGVVTVFARYSLGHGKDQWLKVECGFYFVIDSKSSTAHPPLTYVYAWAYGGPIKDDEKFEETEIDFARITSKAEASTEKVEKVVNARLKSVLNDVLADGKAKLNKQQQAAIKLLVKSLAG